MQRPPAPDFAVFGVPKAGTTALFTIISQHPQIFAPHIKEPNYFHYATGLPRIKTQFLDIETKTEYLALYQSAQPNQMRGDFSVTYWGFPEIGATMLAHNPAMKFVAVLRNPIERAWSSYWQLKRTQDGIDAAFETMIEEAERLGPNTRESDKIGRLVLTINTGNYFHLLQQWLKHIPRENLLLIRFENLRDQPQPTVKTLFRFLAVAEDFEPVTNVRVNEGGVVQRRTWLSDLIFRDNAVKAQLSKFIPPLWRQRILSPLRRRMSKPTPALPPASRARLANYYAADVAALAEFTGWDLSSWRQ